MDIWSNYINYKKNSKKSNTYEDKKIKKLKKQQEILEKKLYILDNYNQKQLFTQENWKLKKKKNKKKIDFDVSSKFGFMSKLILINNDFENRLNLALNYNSYDNYFEIPEIIPVPVKMKDQIYYHNPEEELEEKPIFNTNLNKDDMLELLNPIPDINIDINKYNNSSRYIPNNYKNNVAN